MPPVITSLIVVGTLANVVAYGFLYRRERPSREACPRTPAQVFLMTALLIAVPMVHGFIVHGSWLLAAESRGFWMLGLFVASLVLPFRVKNWRKHHEGYHRLKALVEERARRKGAARAE